MFQAMREAIAEVPRWKIRGSVSRIQGLTVEVVGLGDTARVGSRVMLDPDAGAESIAAEVVGFADGRVIVLPFGPLQGLAMGASAALEAGRARIFPCEAWRGRVVDGLGRPLDGSGPLPRGAHPVALRNAPPPAHQRGRVGEKIDLGVRALNLFASCCEGQRLGLFAGSGVGKSVLMSMLARHTQCDVAVIGLIGERGREVQEFLEESLGPAGRERSVVVAATSDETPLMRREAAFMTLAIAEYFRDQGAQVLCMMDSVTRFAMAQREIGLAAGEPPTTKGYPPTVFSELPRLLERAGPGMVSAGAAHGAITGLFTVLVDGGDHDEPVADAVRGILDGHVVMERAIAERGRYPAINVLKSVSRTMPGCNTPNENALVVEARQVLARYEDMAELIRLGAYRRGSDPDVDRAIALAPQVDALLSQGPQDQAPLDACYAALQDILSQDIVP